ncbi:MAG: endonuclease [Bacteroidales bacterium]|jgi:predicted extracellular nuclease|nr:endonuclease [Bacteroidales bacterium]
MNKLKFYAPLLCLLFIFFSSFFSLFSQDTLQYGIVFYNVENLFHPDKDSIKDDGAYTPEGFNHWNKKKYYKKIANTAKVFLAIHDDNPPAIIGMAEIENKQVLNSLCYYSPLKNYHYQYVHYNSPDRRGVGVALLYRPDLVEIVYSSPISIVFPFEPKSQNRDVLFVVAKLSSEDTLYLFVNHWTSRFGGLAATIPKRNYYASVIKAKTDSLFLAVHHPNMIILGDLNDYPTDESVNDILQARKMEDDKEKQQLINLMLNFDPLKNQGSHKFEDFWGCLDQIIVSSNLLDNQNKIQIKDLKASIFNAPFLLEPDSKYGGNKPFRTFLGPRYKGGFSDHLPVSVNLIAF